MGKHFIQDKEGNYHELSDEEYQHLYDEHERQDWQRIGCGSFLFGCGGIALFVINVMSGYNDVDDVLLYIIAIASIVAILFGIFTMWAMRK